MFQSIRHICKSLLVALFVLVTFTVNAQEHGQAPTTTEAHPAQAGHGTEHGGHEAKKGFNFTESLYGHISDTHDWHIVGNVSVPLPVIIWNNGKLHTTMSSSFEHGHKDWNGFYYDKEDKKGNRKIKEKILARDGSDVYDFSITKNVLSLIIGCIILLVVMIAAGKTSLKNGITKAPTGAQNVLEPIIIFLRDNVAKAYLGDKWRKYMPILLTFFFFIWINNLLGLLPFGFNLTGNIACTALLALVFFIVMLFNSNKYFWGHIFNPPGVPGFVKFILVPIEFISIFIKPVALALRLFANIFAGHTIILCIMCIIFILGDKFGPVAGYGFSPISIGFSIFMFFIELLVAALQAFIFTNLAAVFIGSAIEEHHHDDAHGHAHAH